MDASPKAKIVAFVILTAALSAIFEYLLIRNGLQDPRAVYYGLGLMWCPGVAALVVRAVTQRNLRGQGWHLGAPRYLLLAYLLPVFYALPVYGAVWISGLGGLRPSAWMEGAAALGIATSPATGLLVLAILGASRSFLFAAGEEIGWRGLLVPELAKIASFRRTVVISAVIWTLYHVPILLFAGYNGGSTPIWYSLACFTMMVFSQSVVFTWIRLRSGSLWPAALLHAAHNLFVQRVFDGATVERSLTRYVTGEFGIGLAITIGVAGWLLLRADRSFLPGRAAAGAKLAPGGLRQS